MATDHLDSYINHLEQLEQRHVCMELTAVYCCFSN